MLNFKLCCQKVVCSRESCLDKWYGKSCQMWLKELGMFRQEREVLGGQDGYLKDFHLKELHFFSGHNQNQWADVTKMQILVQ